MTKIIGFVGTGPINSTLARFAIQAGFTAVVSNSRGPESLSEVVANLGPQARAATVEEVAQASDIVVVSIPLHFYDQLPAEAFVGKVVVDTMNYYPQRCGRIDVIEDRTLTTSEMVQQHLQEARVVKALYSLDMFHLDNGPRPTNDPERWALPVAGDHADAKAAVSQFMDAIGFDAVDCGDLADSWRIQQATPVYVLPYVGVPPEGISKEERRVWFRADRSKVVTADQVRELAAQAKRSDRVGALFEDLPSG